VPVNQRENTGKSLLNVFNSVRGWVSIDESVNQRGNHYFGDVGKNIVYAISESSGHDQEMTGCYRNYQLVSPDSSVM